MACAGLLQSGELTAAEVSALVEAYAKLGGILGGLKHQKLMEQFDV